MGLTFPSFHLCNIHAPTPCVLASLATIMSRLGLKCVKNKSDVSLFFISRNACSHSFVQIHFFSLRSTSLSGALKLCKLGIKSC